ncbi:MAG: cytidine deaminase [Bacteroidetes bacterium]|nr:cytidine deaminase [Bacteroidota bacterium]
MIIKTLNKDWVKLSNLAWKVRENAFIYGKTKVGAAVLTKRKKYYAGCNIEHKYRSHDIHAEVNAISTMVSKGDKEIDKILIVAERDFFTPCGSCMDWIMQFSSDKTIVGFQNAKKGGIVVFGIHDLMPFYPK